VSSASSVGGGRSTADDVANSGSASIGGVTVIQAAADPDDDTESAEVANELPLPSKRKSSSGNTYHIHFH
jgi:hypothetical protein